jgi:hypothetical protein
MIVKTCCKGLKSRTEIQRKINELDLGDTLDPTGNRLRGARAILPCPQRRD